MNAIYVRQKTLVLLGPAGSFSDAAANKLGKNWKKIYVSSIEKIFEAVRRRKAFGFVPVKNKIIGSVPKSEEGFKKMHGQLHILRRIKFPVRFVLAAKKKIPLKKIQKVYCPLVVADQCRKFLRKKLPHAKLVTDVDSSSASYKKIVQLARFSLAAIGSERGAKLYKLKILGRNIQDDPKDWTEFVLIKIEI